MPPLSRFILCLLLFISNTLHASQYFVMTEELAPLAFKNNDKIEGLSVEIVTEILKILNIKTDILLLPWARAYHEILTKPNQVLFSMSRNNERENLFHWVGPIIEDKVYFYSPKNSTLNITTIEEAKKAPEIIVSRGFPEHQFLQNNNFKNLSLIVSPNQGFKLIAANRSDLMPAGELTMVPSLKKLNIAPELIKNTNVSLFSHYLYIAMSIDTDHAEVARWQNALDKMKTDGTYDSILEKYLPGVRNTPPHSQSTNHELR